MKGKTALIALILFLSGLSFAEQPYWWESPHKDDDEFMYERGSSTDGSSEQDAVRKAVRSAKTLIMERIGIAPALESAGLEVSPEFALVNCEVSGTATDKTGKYWRAWLLVKYPQKEKERMLERWNASVTTIKELKAREEKIPVQFRLSFSTADGRTQFRAGEPVSFKFQAERDSYLLILDHQSNGATVLLFPNRFHPECFVKKGEVLLIPPPDDPSFRLVVGEPFGDDRVEAIASTDESALHRDFARRVRDLKGGLDFAAAERASFTRAIDSEFAESGKKDDGSKALWSRAEINLSTYPR